MAHLFLKLLVPLIWITVQKFDVQAAFCGGQLTATAAVQTFQSPNYPNNYPSNADCQWTLTAPLGTYVQITFVAFDVEDSFQGKCDYDYVEVDGLQYCAHKPPPPVKVKGDFVIKFHSDDGNEYKGFQVSYVIIPNEVNRTAIDFNNQFLAKTTARDILFIVDWSLSISDADIKQIRTGLEDLLELICRGVGSDANSNRVAILLFSKTVKVIHHFVDVQDLPTIIRKIRTMTHQRPSTCTGVALNQGYDMFARSRPNVPHNTLVITDGESNCGPKVQQAAQTLAKRSQVYCLGVGLENNKAAHNEVRSIASDDDNNIFAIKKYVEFNQMLDYIKAKKRNNNNPCVPIEDF